MVLIRLGAFPLLLTVLGTKILPIHAVCSGEITACDSIYTTRNCSLGDACTTAKNSCKSVCQRAGVDGYNSPCQCSTEWLSCDAEGCNQRISCSGDAVCTDLANALDCSMTRGCNWTSPPSTGPVTTPTASEEATPPPTSPPTWTPSGATTIPPTENPTREEDPERTDKIKAYLIEQGISTEADLNSDGSAQQKALSFISVQDGYDVDVPEGDKSTPEGYSFMTRYVLTVLYYATLGDRWVYTLNFLQPFDVCYWYSVLQYPDLSQEFRGVACDDNGTIASLFLESNNMEGTLPDELSLLTTLAAMDLNFNLLRGSIPDSFQALTALQNIFIMSNRITGGFPAWVEEWTSIRNINFAHNLLVGSLPAAIGNVEGLKGLAVDNNLLTGTLEGIFDTNTVPGLRELQQFYIENNLFEGIIEEGFLKDSNLTHLDISDNRFHGNVSMHLFEMQNLKVLDLHDNDFDFLPDDIPINTKLEMLALQKCQFANQKIPGSIHNLESLRHLDVSQNFFSGFIPPTIGSLSDLTYLFLSQNDFLPGPIPSWILGLSKLEELSLKTTQRTGTIPYDLGNNLEELLLLDLDNNRLEGKIPETLGSLSNLHILTLNRNNITSVIPSTFKNLQSLKLFFVEANNDITGDLDDLYCANPSFLLKPVVVADCELCTVAAPECCTACCEKGVECNPGVYVPDLDPIWQLSYKRVFFTFGRDDFFDKEITPAGNGPDAFDDSTSTAVERSRGPFLRKT